MKICFVAFLLLGAGAAASFAAEEKDSKVTSRDALNARIREEHARKQGAATTTAPASTDPAGKAPASAAFKSEPKDSKPAATVAASPAPATKPKDAAVRAKDEPATVLPKVEVTRSRINELDGRIIAQEQEIAREKENTRPTEFDKALNHPKVSKVLSILGGESSAHRATVSGERVKIMEEERDLLEAMKAAKTPEEKAALQKELAELRAYRRELEKSLR